MSYILQIPPFHELHRRFHTVVAIQFVFFALLNAEASAFEQSGTASVPGSLAASLQSKLKDFHDLQSAQVETQSQSTSRFDGTFRDIDKESKKLRFESLSIITSLRIRRYRLNRLVKHSRIRRSRST